MSVANSFDLWQRDAFFSAAEEVQQSADRMESAYRTWLRARREELLTQHLEELGRELQMALGTAKWQLEEFERAVRLSYTNNGEELTIKRHRHFVSAIQDQISHVEIALKESLNKDGKKAFRWVVLDEEEYDDFALFLSGTPGNSQMTKEESLNLGSVGSISLDKYKSTEDYSLCEVNSKMQIPNLGKSSEDAISGIEVAKCYTEPQESRLTDAVGEINDRADQIGSNRRAWSSPDKTPIKIVIDRHDRQNNVLIEATPKDKGYKSFFSRSGMESNSGMVSHKHMRIVNWIKQQLRFHRSQRQQLSPALPVKSGRFILVFMLAIFLVVPFLLYSA